MFIGEKVNMMAEKIFIYSDKTMKLEKGSQVMSTIEHQCDYNKQDRGLYECISHDYKKDTFEK